MVISTTVNVSLPPAMSAIGGKPGGEIHNFIIFSSKEKSTPNSFMVDEKETAIC